MVLPPVDAAQLLTACASLVPDDLSQHPLLIFYQHHTAPASSFSLIEHVTTLSAAAQLALLSAVNECLLELLGRQQHTSVTTSESQHAASLCLIDCVITVVQASLPTSPSATLSPPLLSCLQQLHDALLTFQHTTASHIQHHIATLLTTAYSTQPSSLLSLLPFLLPYLLLKCLEPSVRRPDILALHSLRAAFAHFDYTDETSASLVQLLARAALHPPLLRSREGRQLLAAVWSTSTLVGEAMHAAVKEQCVTGRRSLLEHYGDVYYRVWKESDEGGEGRRQCEGWLQQLMHLCLHCSLPRTHQSLLQLLHVLHSHRKQRDVELLLARLYEPLLFRALSAAHPLLRLHALSVLVDVFPLASLDAEVPQETHIAQQMQALLSALSDAYAPSRAVAVRGICLILSLYWELFSAEVKVDTVTAVIALREDMAASSRIAVCDGIRTLLSCHLSHQLLQPLLPSLAPLLHDRSDAAQSAFLSLLLAVKALRDIRYYHIAPLPTLLLCLQHAAGNEKLAAKLRQLLANSFWPDGGSSALLVRRLMVMAGENAAAARVFYGGSGSEADQQEKVRLTAGLVQLLTVSATAADKENARPAGGKKAKQPRAKKSKAADDDEGGSAGVTATLPPIDPHDTPLVETLVVILASLWQQLHHSALQDGDGGDGEYGRLVERLAAMYGRLLDVYGGLSVCVRSALLSMLPQLPAEATGSTAASLPALAALPSEADVEAYAPLLDCLVQWDKAPQLLLLITRAMHTAAQHGFWSSTNAQRQRIAAAEQRAEHESRSSPRTDAEAAEKVSKGARRKQQRQADEQRVASEITGLYLDPTLAVRCLSYMFVTQRLRSVLLTDGVRARRVKKTQQSTVGLCGGLKTAMDSLTDVWNDCRRLVSVDATVDAAQYTEEAKEYLCSGAELLMRATVHVHAECAARAGTEEDDGYETQVSDWPDRYAQLMETADACMASLAASPPSTEQRGATRSKRNKSVVAVNVSLRVLLLAVQLTTDLLALDYASPSAVATVSPATHMHEWLSQLTALDPSSPVLSAVAPALFKLFYHLTLATTSSTSASSTSQHYPWDDQLDHPLLPYSTYADLYRMLLSLLPAAGDTGSRSVLEALQVFRAANHSERTLLNIALSTLPFVPPTSAAAATQLTVQLVTRSPSCTAHLPSLLAGVWAQSVGLGMVGLVGPLLCGVVRGVGEWVEERVKDRARRQVVWAGLVKCMRGMKEQVGVEAGEEVVEAVTELECEVEAKWKENGGHRTEAEADDELAVQHYRQPVAV